MNETIQAKLTNTPQTASELAEVTGGNLSTIRKYLKRMREKGSITYQKKGGQFVYTLPHQPSGKRNRAMLTRIIRERLVKHQAAMQLASTPQERRRRKASIQRCERRLAALS